MFVSQKCQYALRAVFELAKRIESGPVKASDIADAQAIPLRFLEVILNQLKQGGFVESQRGSRGGYSLSRSPRRLTVGEVIRFIDGPIAPVVCTSKGALSGCPLLGNCVFLPMWQKVEHAISEVYDNTTFQDLVDQEALAAAGGYVPSYSI